MNSRMMLSLLLAVAALARCANVPSDVEGLQQINGTQLFVKTMGRGEPLIIVHGGPGFDHSYFLPQMAELAADYRLVFYDQRVSGRSSADLEPDEITLEEFIGDIEGLREFLGVERIHLMGHSFGGMLAMQYALRHPDRLHSLMLVNSTAASSEYMGQVNQLLSERLSPEARRRQAEIAESEAFKQGEPDAIREFMLVLLSANFHDPGKVEQLNLSFPDDFMARSERLQALAGDLSEYDLYPMLGEIHCPTLIVRGDSEVLPEEATDRIRDAIPGSQMHVLADCGHFPFVECNDQLQATLREFLGNL